MAQSGNSLKIMKKLKIRHSWVTRNTHVFNLSRNILFEHKKMSLFSYPSISLWVLKRPVSLRQQTDRVGHNNIKKCLGIIIVKCKVKRIRNDPHLFICSLIQ